MTIYDKEAWVDAFTRNVRRPGADRLLAWLDSTDFFTAPASTRFHGAFEGGLCSHSVNVYLRLAELRERLQGVPGMPQVSDETVAVCGLLHDVCKANFYGVEMRNRKNDQGRWEKYPFYTVSEKFAYGHGEKSVFLIERFMRLTTEEAVAIRFHMGAFDESTRNTFGQAVEQAPLAFWLHTADMMASHFDEAGDCQK